MTEQRPNWRRLANGDYLVRTQAGFNRAIRDFFTADQQWALGRLEGYPQVYPSVVHFEFLHGRNLPQATCTALALYQRQLMDLLADLDSE